VCTVKPYTCQFHLLLVTEIARKLLLATSAPAK
jgi:hypothetical protein